MGRLTPDEFRKKYAELPPNLREAYGSVKTTEILEEIGKKHGLRVDQIGELVDETGYVMLGVTPPSDYVMKIEGAVNVSREKAKAVAIDVNDRVFKPIRDALKQVHKVGGHRDIPPQNRAALSADMSPPREYALPPQPPAPEGGAPGVAAEEPPEPERKTAPPQSLSEERLTKTFALPYDEKTYTVSENG
ncbi:MAG: hypothetical protein HYS73_00975, partial [Parcubacteria group bacterium]|nr:hypothetical protein [Parcubacteria group bacterium]